MPDDDVTAFNLESLPDCAAVPLDAWHWTDPAQGDALLGDHSGIWENGQLLAPPRNAQHHQTWLAQLRSWRSSCQQTLGLSDELFDIEDLHWTQQAFVQVQMHPLHADATCKDTKRSAC